MRTGELAVALVLDAALGEPPVAAHPVVAMGRLIDVLEHRLPAGDAPNAVAVGGLATAAGAAVVWTVAAAARRLPWPLRGVVLWGLLSGRLLWTEVDAVEAALLEGGLDAGRERVARLVSRDTSGLSAAQVRGAAVSTLAENANDGFVATLWWWTLGGLPAAAVHRWLDTLDSRWGYRTERFDRPGRIAARADDVAAWAPARLTALLWRGRLDAALRREARQTPSPNAGWPMAAAALRADVRLEKPGVYVLHEHSRAPDADAVRASLRRALVVGAAAASAALGCAHLRDRAAGPRAGGAA